MPRYLIILSRPVDVGLLDSTHSRRLLRLKSGKSPLRLSHGYVVSVIPLDRVHHILRLDAALQVKQFGNFREQEPHV